MNTLLHLLLPGRADNTIRGVKLPVYVFTVIAAISTARSLIHLLAPTAALAASLASIWPKPARAGPFSDLDCGAARNCCMR